MGKKTNYFKIGLFFIFAVVVFMTIIISLGAGILNKEKIHFETYIDESVQGLSIGSPVKHRGVQIGRVEKISFAANEYGLDPNSMEYIGYNKYVMVLIAAEADMFTFKDKISKKKMVKRMVDEGLRLRLTQQPLTGIAYLEADYFETDKYPIPELAWYPKNIYIPSVRSMVSNFTKSAESTLEKIAKIDFEDLSINLNNLLTNMDKMVKESNLPRLADSTVKLIDEIKQSNESLKSFINELRTTNQQVNELFTPARETQYAASLPQLIADLDKTVMRIDKMIAAQNPDIEQTMKQLRSTAENLNEISEEIHAYPKQVIFGNPPAQTEVYK